MTEPREAYSPERRTALLITGTGADGAYHAGALKALHEAGVKIDIVGGRGIGAIAAVLSAVDGGLPLWDDGGLWRGAPAAAFYVWHWPFRLLRWTVMALGAAIAAPLVIVVAAAAVYPVALALGMAGLTTGATIIRQLLAGLDLAFAPSALPTWIPQLATLVAFGTLVVLAFGALVAWLRQREHRRGSGGRVWALIGALVDGSAAIRGATEALWRLLNGGAVIKTPEAADLSRRYVELLRENLGQPGFRELLLVVHDLDARRDLVFGLLRDPFRKALFPMAAGVSARRAEAQDLAAGTPPFVVDVLAAALSVPGVTAPHLVRFAPDAYWRGEAHRLADRPAGFARLLEEAAAAGAEQVVIVSAAPVPPGPHELRPARRDGFGQMGDQLAATETAVLADAVRHLQHRFQGVYLIRPSHNPVRPFDLAGAYDDRSDRHQSLDELMAQGYHDAYRLFIEPIVGASGDRIAQREHTP